MDLAQAEVSDERGARRAHTEQQPRRGAVRTRQVPGVGEHQPRNLVRLALRKHGAAPQSRGASVTEPRREAIRRIWYFFRDYILDKPTTGGQYAIYGSTRACLSTKRSPLETSR